MKTIQLTDVIIEYDEAPADASWDEGHTIFQMADHIDRLRTENAALKLSLVTVNNTANKLEKLLAHAQSCEVDSRRLRHFYKHGNRLGSLWEYPEYIDWIAEIDDDMRSDPPAPLTEKPRCVCNDPQSIHHPNCPAGQTSGEQ